MIADDICRRYHAYLISDDERVDVFRRADGTWRVLHLRRDAKRRFREVAGWDHAIEDMAVDVARGYVEARMAELAEAQSKEDGQ